MTSQTLELLLDTLDELKHPTGARERVRLEKILAQVARRHFTEAASLIRFHEILLFLRAYPQSASLLKQTEKILATFKQRVDHLRATGADVSIFSDSDVSGIAGTHFSAIFSYDIVRWLNEAHPARVELVWDRFAEQARIAAVWPKLLPLFEEDAYVDAHVSFLEWLRAAKRENETDLAWLLRAFASLSLPEKDRGDLWDSLQLWVRWEFVDADYSRTRMKRDVRRIFYHTKPLLSRRDVSLAHEWASTPMPLEELTREDGASLIALARDTMASRFRELHGFTHADPAQVWRAEAGRGVEIFVFGVPRARRLPTLAYHAGMLFKNGVPIAYTEALTLFERTEIGFNLFYTFREGESAWLYARIMRLFNQMLGVRTFSVDPYQLGGSGNDEGLESGAFWFYRKLGFRSTDPEIAKLINAEERKIKMRPGYRTPARTLSKIAEAHAIYDAPDADIGGVWDHFRLHHLGLALARRMSREFDSDAQKIREASTREVARALGANIDEWSKPERCSFADFSLILGLISNLSGWPAEEKLLLQRIIRAKARANELQYVRLLQSHKHLREKFIQLGSA